MIYGFHLERPKENVYVICVMINRALGFGETVFDVEQKGRMSFVLELQGLLTLTSKA